MAAASVRGRSYVPRRGHRAVVADLELYCQFIDSARDWVINQALKNVFGKDKAFLAWKEKRTPAAAPAPTKAEKMKPHRAETASLMTAA